MQLPAQRPSAVYRDRPNEIPVFLGFNHATAWEQLLNELGALKLGMQFQIYFWLLLDEALPK